MFYYFDFVFLLDFQSEKKFKLQLRNNFLIGLRIIYLKIKFYRMAYFTVVSNHGSYREIHHEFKLFFFHRTTVVPVNENIIPKTYFNMFPFSELLNMTQDYDYLVGMYIVVLFFYLSLFKRVMKIFNKLCFFETDVIGLLTSVGEEKEHAEEENIVKMIVLELSSKECVDLVIFDGFYCLLILFFCYFLFHYSSSFEFQSYNALCIVCGVC
ncbi:hypothetical protein S245_025753 [Arachis hypogaea]|nr:DNA primase [Arachis hypogaea]